MDYPQVCFNICENIFEKENEEKDLYKIEYKKKKNM
jgi:hypothetical protein